jgi:hypothetical protein
MKKKPPRASIRETDPSENDIEPTVEIVQLALVDARPDGSGYDPYNTRCLTPASRVPPKMDIWKAKSKRG